MDFATPFKQFVRENCFHLHQQVNLMQSCDGIRRHVLTKIRADRSELETTAAAEIRDNVYLVFRPHSLPYASCL